MTASNNLKSNLITLVTDVRRTKSKLVSNEKWKAAKIDKNTMQTKTDYSLWICYSYKIATIINCYIFCLWLLKWEYIIYCRYHRLCNVKFWWTTVVCRPMIRTYTPRIEWLQLLQHRLQVSLLSDRNTYINIFCFCLF